MVFRVGRAAVAALAFGTAVAGAAEVSSLVKARVTVAGDVRRFLHEVVVANRGEPRRVTSVLLWQNVWLPLEPKDLVAPPGWRVRSLLRDGPGGFGWAVEFDCSPTPPAGGAGAAAPAGERKGESEAACGIGPGEEVTFRVTLPYPAESLRSQGILVGFSDGRLAIAS
jgi:hypothetical protein